MKTRKFSIGKGGKRKNAFFEICNAVKTAPPVIPQSPVKTVFANKPGAKTYTPATGGKAIQNTQYTGITQAQIDESKRQEAERNANDPNWTQGGIEGTGGSYGKGAGAGAGAGADSEAGEEKTDILGIIKKYWYIGAIAGAILIYFFVIRKK